METAVNQIDPDTDVPEETTAVKTETIDPERMSQECQNSQKETSYDAASELIPCVSIPQSQEEGVEYPIQIKHEPELILEPEELPDAEAMTNDDEPSDALRNKVDPNKCYICNIVFETPKDVQVHLSDHLNMIPYQCSACTIKRGKKLKIASLNQLHRHFRMHVSAIKCPECPYQTRTEWAMHTHTRKYHGHSDQVEYICKQCGKKYQNSYNFYVHMLRHKAVNEARYPCSYCDKKLPSKTALVEHERKHTGEKPYQCYVCAESFCTSWSLKGHIADIHTKSILTCKFEGCDFSTVNKHTYKFHKAKHELKFQCTQCSQRFPTGKHLKRHQYVHTGVKRFQCEQCDKSFQHKASLQQHVAAHNNDRRYACEICEFSSVRKQGLKYHLLQHSDELTYGCRHCDMKFRHPTVRTQHEKKTHIKTAVKLSNLDTDAPEGTTLRKKETIDAERMLSGCRDSQSETSYDAAPKLTPSVSIPQPQEEPIDLPVQIKHEPELILDPEELPTVAYVIYKS